MEMFFLALLLLFAFTKTHAEPTAVYNPDDTVTVTLDDFADFVLSRVKGLYKEDSSDAKYTFSYKGGDEWIVYNKNPVDNTETIVYATGEEVTEYIDGEVQYRDLSEVSEAGCTARYPPGFIPLDAGITDIDAPHVLVPNGNGTLIDENITGTNETLFSRRVLQDQYAFYPGCYDFDHIQHVMDIGITADVAFTNKYGGTIAGAQAGIELIMSTSSTVYELQMNIKLRISQLVIADGANQASLDSFFRRGGTKACSTDSNLLLSDITAYSKKSTTPDAAHWHLLSGCMSSGYRGLAYVGTVCESHWITGVSIIGSKSKAWRVFAHEVGHGFAAEHSFENGMTKTGGIMDYGDGTLIGTDLYRFRQARKGEMCGQLAKAKNSGCAYMSVFEAPPTTDCGDGTLAVDEECECVGTSVTSCTGCTNCVLDNPAQECSSGVFYMHKNKNAPVLGPLEFASSECCSGGVTQPVTTQCNGGSAVCQVGGRCSDPCTNGLTYCGQCGSSVGSGCRAQCLYSQTNVCTYNWQDGDGNVMGDLPAGSKCSFGGTAGVCNGVGLCVTSSGGSTGDRHCIPLNNPTPQPTNPTPQPTIPPVNYPTPQPTSPPVTPTSQPETTPFYMETTTIAGAAGGVGVISLLIFYRYCYSVSAATSDGYV